ncbi:MAG TPA: hypothetical protein VEK07_17645 [Polyangiaceae bacterium]|nr:hypothetical protein [Polyangiaceae bacterium]
MEAAEMGEGLEPGADPDLGGTPRRDQPQADESVETLLLARWRDMVQRRPLLSVTAVAAVGAALGGLLFTRMGRLAFFAAAGYAANELWHSERRLELGELIANISRTPARPSR